MSVYRIYVEKKAPYAVEAAGLLSEIHELPGMGGVTGLRMLNRYDVEGISPELFGQAGPVVFYEPQLDEHYASLPQGADAVFAVEYLPGQFDQRADSCAECIQLISQGERPEVASARVYLLSGDVSADMLARIKKHVINPVESREASLEERSTIKAVYPIPTDVAVVDGFTVLDNAGLEALISRMGLAMDAADAAFCRDYFAGERRDPTVTEIRMIDTYWSDHCRHTTFGTVIDDIKCDDERVKGALERYAAMRRELGREQKPVTLMDMATIGAKYLKSKGLLSNLDESEEINACSIRITVDNGGKDEDWLLMFKNETHNHPTEIEPFGGAATCIGGAIRDPLSGRSYVYQAMRVTGAADPLAPVSATLPGKLPQRKLTVTAAAGYSSYGNQIGLATGLVDELYHPGYAAKHMEIGAVVGAAPLANVRRERPVPGDAVILLGGRTGRDGCGGATGSSKSHSSHSLETCGAEVQKGNAPVERKLQRLFRDPEVTRLIKRCNDFGAGGVSVAIGELADGLEIDLDRVPRKYEGLDGTELAISESQERMAVVVSSADADKFIELAKGENLEATSVAVVTQSPRLVMRWRGKTIVDVSREFLDSNGADKHAAIEIPRLPEPDAPLPAGESLAERLKALVSDLAVCGRRGLCERFDSTIGAGTVLMPFGGKYQDTPAQVMAAKLPVFGETSTCSGMAWDFDPWLSQQNPFEAAYLAVAGSLARLTAAGFSRKTAYLTFQEYFEKLRDEPLRWGKPAAALLGALMAQADLGAAAIGGKDSMSGSFEQLDVPPTLVSFAVSPGNTGDIISPEFKDSGNKIAYFAADPLRDSRGFLAVLDEVEALIKDKKIISAWAIGHGGMAEGIFKMALGNRIGAALEGVTHQELFGLTRCGILAELSGDAPMVRGRIIGRTTGDFSLCAMGEAAALEPVRAVYEARLEPVFPHLTAAGSTGDRVEKISFAGGNGLSPAIRTAAPRALIPVFPGTNCEYDTARALRRAGAVPTVMVINNLTPSDVSESIIRMEKLIDQSQMIVLPGGFSGGDEPDGSGKLITAFFRNPRLTDAVHRLLMQRDGLMLGICNGFQALIKLGLLPRGEISATDADCATLTFNTVGRHQSMLVNTRIASNLSPWLSRCAVDEVYTVAVSHGEGRFVAPPALARRLAASGQIVTQYVDPDGAPTMDLRYNPNGSLLAVEGICSPDGHILGKMGHSERSGDMLYKNVPGNRFQPIFEGGVAYFRD